MELVSYVASRMLKDVCGIDVIINPAYEPTYRNLCSWTDHCSTWRGPGIFPGLPSVKETVAELSDDMLIIYVDFLTRVPDVNSRGVVHGLFTVSLYMMIKYKDYPDKCYIISENFELITQRLGGWRLINESL